MKISTLLGFRQTKKYLRAYAKCADSHNPAHAQFLIQAFAFQWYILLYQWFWERAAEALRRLRICWSDFFYFHIFNMDPFFHYTSQMTPLAVCNKLNDCFRTCSIGNKAKLSISGTRSAKLQKANARSVQFIAKQFKAFYTNWFKCTSL